MSKNKMVPKAGTATEFLDGIGNAQRRADCSRVLELMRAATGAEPIMWGSSIIGFGTHHYKYDSGREGDTMAVGFAPRAQALVLYGLGQDGENLELLKSLGTHTSGKGCLYVNRLDDINLNVLKRMVKKAFVARQNQKPA